MDAPRELDRLIVQEVRDYAIYLLDTGGRIRSWNQGAELLTGYAPDDVVGRHFEIFFTEEDRARAKPQYEMAVAAEQGRFEEESWRVRKDGTRFWASEVITAVHDDASPPRLTGFLKIVRDLSQRKRMEDKLRQSEERHRLLVDNVRDHAVFMIDPDGRVMTWNPGAQRVFGYAEEEIVGRHGSILFTAEDVAAGEHDKELATALSEGRASDDRWQVRKGGERFWVSGVTTAIRDPGGGFLGFAKVCRDLTERRLAEERQQKLLEQEKLARWEAEKAMRVRDEFLAIVSHELRTPLTAVLLWARLLRTGAVKERERNRALETIEQSAEAQRQLIEDLPDISRITSGKLRLNVRDVEPGPVVHAAVEAVRPMADAKGVRIETSLGPAAGTVGAGTVRADPDRLQQVVWNLVNNAVKFTARGGRVRVALARTDDALRVTVSDTGKGIDPCFLPEVFDVFRQADAGLTREHGGLGLGLSISKRLVEMHGGTIRAESAGEGRGATFTVELPLAEAEAERPGGPPAGAAAVAAAEGVPFTPSPVLQGVRVLLVEDELHTRAVVQWLLEQCGADVTSFDAAAQALDALRGAPPECPFDVLVSDIAMPGQDGYELIRQVRAMEQECGAPRPLAAAALTAYARDADRGVALEAGFQTHLPKPVEPQALVQAVAALAASDGGSRGTRSQ